MTETALRPLLGTDFGHGTARVAQLPAGLRQRYGSDLVIPLAQGRPTVVANFVTTLDGVVAFDPRAGLGGSAVSGHFEPDRFVMGLLRAVSDGVLVGAGTVRSDSRGRWVAASVHPGSAADTAALRADLGLAPNPTTIVVSGSGDLDPGHPGLSDAQIPAVLVTSSRGLARLSTKSFGAHVELVAAGDDRVEPRQLIDVLRARGFQLVLCEGGPHLIGDLTGAQLLDELFLTTAPQLAGHERGDSRLSLVEGRAFSVDEAPWADLVDLRVAGNHLFSRYRFGGKKQ
jgi:riboflavin biosynthesis pyrimidine reductase